MPTWSEWLFEAELRGPHPPEMAHYSGWVSDGGRATVRIRLSPICIGSGAQPAVLRAVATSAEAAGFASLWACEHLVLIDRPASRYPFTADGQVPFPSDLDWLDPLITLSVAAAVTHTIRLATGMLLLSEHNPVHVAKQAASLDRLSGGRLALGVGIGWLAEEFAALGVPFARRGARTADYIAAMRRLWADEVATDRGEFVNFDAVRSNPKPNAGYRYLSAETATPPWPEPRGGVTDGMAGTCHRRKLPSGCKCCGDFARSAAVTRPSSRS